MSRARLSNKGWRLDYMVVNEEYMDKVKESRIMDQYLGSDHCPVELTLNLWKNYLFIYYFVNY